jgi:hypothetical protein
MGQCVSSDAMRGETEVAYIAKWQAGGMGDRLNAYEAKARDALGNEAAKNYNTTVCLCFQLYAYRGVCFLTLACCFSAAFAKLINNL